MIIDCFMFFNEFDILEKRLKYLNDIVDKFVLVETDRTFNGELKEFNYEENQFKYKEYADKIIHLAYSTKVENIDFTKKPEGLDFNTPQWKLENLQRNHLIKALEKFDDDDIVIISDVDEIPDKSAIEFAKNNLSKEKFAFAFTQMMFYYNLKTKQVNDWNGSVITINGAVKQLNPQWFRDNRNNLSRITNGGWHLSYFNTPEMIQYKIKNFAHQEYNHDKYTNLFSIQKQINLGEDLFYRKDNPFEKFDPSNLDKDFLEIFKNYA